MRGCVTGLWVIRTGCGGVCRILLLAVVLGVAFTGLQAYEYAYLMGQDWTFGGDEFFSNFFMATGFHGFHVVSGTIFLFVCYLRVRAGPQVIA